MIRRITNIFGAVFLAAVPLIASGDTPSLLDGDLIFCHTAASGFGDGTLASAISDVTAGDIYHVAIVSCDEGAEPTVIEATTNYGVCERPLGEFLADCHHSPDGRPLVSVGRLKNVELAEGAVERARKYLGRPYDFQYLEGDSAIYCSELVHYAYLDADSVPVFPQQPMSFHDQSGRITDFWIEWYGKWNMGVPEGAPGTNPEGVRRSEELEIIGCISDYMICR